MNFRMKISYSAYQQKCTIQELILKRVLEVYNERKKAGLVADAYPIH